MQLFGEENSTEVRLVHNLWYVYLQTPGLKWVVSALIHEGGSTEELGTWRCMRLRLGAVKQHFSGIQLELTHPVNLSWGGYLDGVNHQPVLVEQLWDLCPALHCLVGGVV